MHKIIDRTQFHPIFKYYQTSTAIRRTEVRCGAEKDKLHF